MRHFLFILVLLISFNSSANLLVHPIRVQFNPSDRSVEMTVLNTSNKTNIYRLEWAENRALPEGGYRKLTAAEAANANTASKLVRFTPRQVTLKAGERQTIKLSVRRPASLKEGEYRSHLLFKALPPPALLNDAEPEETVGMGMKLNIITSFSIPVVVQQGRLDAKAQLVKPTILVSKKGPSNNSIQLELSRTGKHSLHGNLEVYSSVGGSEQLVGRVDGLNFWSELNSLTVKTKWIGKEIANPNQKLHVKFVGARNFAGSTFFDTTVTVDRSMIKQTE